MNKVTFLGSGGARIMLSSQVLATGGMIVTMDNHHLCIDPGPGALVNIFKTMLRPTDLDAIILSHRHLDHSADVNAMIEAMTKGGAEKKGLLFAPSDALDKDPVVLQYLRSYLNAIQVIKPLSTYYIQQLPFTTSMPHHHGPVETYGFLLHGNTARFGYLPDTAYFPELSDFYRETDVLVISMLSLIKLPILHLCVEDAEKIILAVKPRLTILTHFGYKIYQKGPENIAKHLSQKTHQKVLAAKDGAIFTF